MACIKLHMVSLWLLQFGCFTRTPKSKLLPNSENFLPGVSVWFQLDILTTSLSSLLFLLSLLGSKVTFFLLPLKRDKRQGKEELGEKSFEIFLFLCSLTLGMGRDWNSCILPISLSLSIPVILWKLSVPQYLLGGKILCLLVFFLKQCKLISFSQEIEMCSFLLLRNPLLCL